MIKVLDHLCFHKCSLDYAYEESHFRENILNCDFLCCFNLAGPEDAPKVCYKCKKWGHLSRDWPEHSDDSSNRRANGAIDKPGVGLVDSTSETDKVAMEEDIHEIGEEDKEKLNDLDWESIAYRYSLICRACLWVQSYKYHVKVIPGTVKEGKGISFSHIYPSLGSYCSCYICLVRGVRGEPCF